MMPIIFRMYGVLVCFYAISILSVTRSQSPCDGVHKGLDSVSSSKFFNFVSRGLCSLLQTGVINLVATLSYSIGYAGLDAVMQSATHNTTRACRIKVAQAINKAGVTVTASADSAQSAVRSKVAVLVSQSLCPGFGMCADVQDPDDSDVWPITCLTVSPTFPHL